MTSTFAPKGVPLLCIPEWGGKDTKCSCDSGSPSSGTLSCRAVGGAVAMGVATVQLWEGGGLLHHTMYNMAGWLGRGAAGMHESRNATNIITREFSCGGPACTRWEASMHADRETHLRLRLGQPQHLHRAHRLSSKANQSSITSIPKCAMILSAGNRIGTKLGCH